MESGSGMNWKLTAALLIIGHTTTAPWNSFINNDEYFKWKLGGSEPMQIQNYNGNATELFQKDEQILQACIETELSVSNQTGPDEEFSEKVVNCYDKAKAGDDTKKDSSEEETCDYGLYSNFWNASLSSVALGVTFFTVAISIVLVTIPNSQFVRIYGMYTIVVGVFIAVLVMIWQLDTTDKCNVQTFFAGTLVLVVLIIMSSGIAQASMFALTGPMHFTYVVMLMEGQGLGGIFIALLTIVLSAIFKEGTTWGVGGQWPDSKSLQICTSINFGLILFTTLLAVYFFYTVFTRCPEYQKYHSKKREVANSDVSDNEKKFLVIDSKSDHSNHVPLLVIVKHSIPLILSVFTNFFLCLSLFPTIHLQVRSEFSSMDVFGIKAVNYSFLQIALFLVFNIGDWLGKKYAGKRFWSPHSTHITLLSELIRLPIFYVCFFLADITGARDNVFSKSWFFVIAMILFAVTNGYFGSMPMNHASEVLGKKLEDENVYTEKAVNDAKQRVMTVMLLALIGGLMIGAFCNFPLISYVKSMAASEQFQLKHDKISNLAFGGDLR